METGTAGFEQRVNSVGEMSEWEHKLKAYAQQQNTASLHESILREWHKAKADFDSAIQHEEATMTLTLTPEQTRKLKAKAEHAHKSMDAVLDEILGDEVPIQSSAETQPASFHTEYRTWDGKPLKPKNAALIALLQKWREEDEAMTDEEVEQATRDYEELRANLNLNRIRAGEEPLFP